MLELEFRFEDGKVATKSIRLPVDIGRDSRCGIQLKAWRVAKLHARIEHGASGIVINDLGTLTGTVVNGKRVSQYGPLKHGDQILIGPCMIILRDSSSGNSKDGDVVALETSAAPPDVDSVAGFDNALAKQVPPANFNLGVTLHHRRRLHAALLEALDLRRRDIASMSDAALFGEATSVLAEIIQQDTELPDSIDRQALLAEVVNEAVGLGPLEPLLADGSISEIMVNRHDEIYVESAGRLWRHSSTFSSEGAVLGIIERIVSPLGRRIDESSPMVDARLKDGSRVNAVIAPIALRGASLTIRKFPQSRPDINDLLRIAALDVSMSRFLQACVVSRKNIIVSGGTGSGKTTLLNILSNCIPDTERVVTIEDAAELRLDHAHLVTLEARPANLEGRGKIDIRDLVRNALRMRPDRIVIGECRGAEAFDMLAAMNTGHEGSLTTLHANSPRDALSRLETMILMAGMDLPLIAVREHIAASIDLIVQQARLSDGRRLITSIAEVTGTESGRIQIQPLFNYQPGQPDMFVGCGVAPDCFSPSQLAAAGLSINDFTQQSEVKREAGSFHRSTHMYTPEKRQAVP